MDDDFGSRVSIFNLETRNPRQKKAKVTVWFGQFAQPREQIVSDGTQRVSKARYRIESHGEVAPKVTPDADMKAKLDVI
ncbi:MAG: hypothetical protein HC777_01295 [Hyphomonadaceae bacterium]|nr:hypothetical protein [Hyphomonadaceae bacterium]